jgi:glutaminyl-peptide cyclotransferase
VPKLWLKIIFLLIVLFLNCGKKGLPEFDSTQAFTFLEKQCQFGPRNPGSVGHSQTEEFLYQFLKIKTELVRLQEFSYFDSLENKNYELTNLIASFYPDEKKRVLLCAHWDTRPWADKDSNWENRNKPIMGANDGASGVAVLMEIANILKEYQPKFGVDIVFFDGEDLGNEKNNESYCMGSNYFAKNLSGYYPIWGILLDMIGDKDLQIYKETYSMMYAPEVVKLIWENAKKINAESFSDSIKYNIVDDHIQLIKAGIPCADVIDFDYPYWHTLEDTPDKCSPQSLKQVGNVLIQILYQ